MSYDMTVYESDEAKSRNPGDTARFDKSYEILKAAGIGIGRVACASPADIADDEAREIVEAQGMGALPISVYQGVNVSVGAYPSDQELADFLDVPDGTLSVNKQGAPAMGNDLPPAGCACNNNAPDKC